MERLLEDYQFTKKLNKRLEQIFKTSQNLAREFGNPYLEASHLLMAATRPKPLCGNDRVLEALRETGLKPNEIYNEAEASIKKGRERITAPLYLSSGAVEVLEMAQLFSGPREEVSDLDLFRGLIKASQSGILTVRQLQEKRSIVYSLSKIIDQIEKKPDMRLTLSQRMKKLWQTEEHRNKVAAAKRKLFSDPKRKAEIYKASHSPQANKNRAEAAKKYHQSHPEKRFRIGQKIHETHKAKRYAHFEAALGQDPVIVVKKMYYEERLSIKIIAQLAGISRGRLRIFMHEYKIGLQREPNKVGKPKGYSQKRALISEALKRGQDQGLLSQREKQVLESRYLEKIPVSLKGVADKVGLNSAERIRQIESEALNKLGLWLDEPDLLTARLRNALEWLGPNPAEVLKSKYNYYSSAEEVAKELGIHPTETQALLQNFGIKKVRGSQLRSGMRYKTLLIFASQGNFSSEELNELSKIPYFLNLLKKY